MVQENVREVLLTGRKVRETVIVSSQQIRDTTVRYYPGNLTSYSLVQRVDVSELGDKGVHVFNGHDQSIAIQLYGDINQTGSVNGNFSIINSDTLAAGAKKWYGPSAYPILKESFPYLAVQINASVAPTVGDMTVKMEGVQR